jgi:hypothetical protein
MFRIGIALAMGSATWASGRAQRWERNREKYRNLARRIECQPHLLDHQFGLPTVRWIHDGIPMLRAVPEKLASGVGVGKYLDEIQCPELGRRIAFQAVRQHNERGIVRPELRPELCETCMRETCMRSN